MSLLRDVIGAHGNSEGRPPERVVSDWAAISTARTFSIRS
jgi:hypothetical protein